MADDEYGEETEYQEEGEQNDIAGAAQGKEDEVSSLVEGGNTIDALVAAVTEPPILDSKDADLKSKFFQVVLRAFQAMREPDIEKLLAKLDQTQRETLLKFVYRGLQEAECCALLLKLHASIVKKDGLGSVCRVLCARRTV